MAEAIQAYTEALNVVLAVLLAMASFGAINKMHFRSTRPCVFGAMLLVFAGAAAYALSPLLAGWDVYADTALLGGAAVLVLATQRTPHWFAERFANPVASLVAIAAGAVFLLGAMTARAQAPSPGAVRMDCQQLAKAVASAMVFRDVGADLKKLEASVRAHAGAQAGPHLEATLREIRRAWPLGQPPEETAFATYQRCTRQLGNMGREG